MTTNCQAGVEFSDFNELYTYSPECTVRPDNLEELQTVVAEAGAARRTIRAVGTGYSLTECARGDQVSVRPGNLNGMIRFRSSTNDGPVPVSQAALDRGNGYVLAESGCRLRELAATCSAFGAFLPSYGATFFQTIAGAISTSTHGSHLNRAPLCDWIKAAHVVSSDRREYWVEGTGENRVTDRAQLLASDFWHDGIVEVYDDTALKAVRVGLGSLGVIYSLLLEVTPSANLLTNTTEAPWPSIRQQLADGGIRQIETRLFGGRSIEFYSVLMCLGTMGLCWVTERYPVDAAEPLIPLPGGIDEAAFGAWLVFNGKWQALEALLGDRTLLGNACNNWTDDDIRDISYQLLQRSTPIGTYVDNPLSTAGVFAPEYPLRANSVEYIFDADSDEYLEFIGDISGFITNNMCPGLLSLRFTRKSEALLAMQKFERCAHVEVMSLRGFRRNQNFLELLHRQGRARGGVPHWGQQNVLTADDVEAIYGRNLRAWRRIKRRFNGYAHDQFTNEHDRERGLEPKARDSLLFHMMTATG